jgi:hypothetical protein
MEQGGEWTNFGQIFILTHAPFQEEPAGFFFTVHNGIDH